MASSTFVFKSFCKTQVVRLRYNSSIIVGKRQNRSKYFAPPGKILCYPKKCSVLVD